MSKQEEQQLPNYGPTDYVKFFGAGALAATLTHGAATPIDVVKTRIQVDDAMKGLNMIKAGRTIVANEGAAALLTGFGPTAVGYLIQGGGKFAGYEFFKKKFIEMSGSTEKATQRRTAIYLGASATAEFFADIALSPLEATRIRLVSQRGYASGLATGFMRMAREEGLRGFYSGFVPLLFKQVPYAVGQFSVHEAANEMIYRAMGPERKAKLTQIESTGVELTSGVVAGVAAAVLSHPADTLLSAINKGAGDKSQSTTARMFSLAREFGPRRLLTTGLGPRVVMTCGLVAGQFVIYAQCKALVGAPPGIEIHKEESLAENSAVNAASTKCVSTLVQRLRTPLNGIYRTAINVNGISLAADVPFKESEKATVLQVDVIEMTEDPYDKDVIEFDVARDLDASRNFNNTGEDSNLVPDGSHVLAEDLELSKDRKAETGTSNKDEASKATESSEADETSNVGKDCLFEVEDSDVTTKTVDHLEAVRVPRPKSKWLAQWLTEAAEWEECGWSRALGLHASLFFQQHSVPEQDAPFTFSRTGHEIDPSARRQLPEQLLSDKWNKQLSK